MCGENPAACAAVSRGIGSPPRVRGKLRSCSISHITLRITPACAGKTISRSSSLDGITDHPRVCGENCELAGRLSNINGSPPRVRGKRRRMRGAQGVYRITPACAGKTEITNSNLVSSTDHPRVCGENIERYELYLPLYGSPPRVRGKLGSARIYSRRRRITPACAGKTKEFLRKYLRVPDHPRVCGENVRGSYSKFSNNGSPPRVRGKLKRRAVCDGVKRITPACAGKTWRKYFSANSAADHPRVCGENRVDETPEDWWDGSPPRVRGKPCSNSRPSTMSRITPACAGKTRFPRVGCQYPADHPRVCGENLPYSSS